MQHHIFQYMGGLIMLLIKYVIDALLLNSGLIFAKTEVRAVRCESFVKPTCNISGLEEIDMKDVTVGGLSEVGLLQLGIRCPYTIQSHLTAWASNISANKKIMYLDVGKKISFQLKKTSSQENVLFDGSAPLCEGSGVRSCIYDTYLSVAPDALTGDYSGVVTFRLYYN